MIMKTESPQHRDTETNADSTTSYVVVALMGIYLGILFAKSEVAHWQRVHDMFLFREAHMYLIICTAIMVAMLSMRAIKRFSIKSIDGKPITYKGKPFHTGVVIGGMLFGVGWAITGACPGPIYAQIGAGEWRALFTLGGAIAGMFCYAALKPRLPH
jgi:uncharacterized membrane protein YedE/YeeE